MTTTPQPTDGAIDPTIADKGPWYVAENGKAVYSDDFTVDARLVIDGDFIDDYHRKDYAAWLVGALNATRPAPLGGGVVSDAELLEWFDMNPRAVWRSSGYREHSDAWSYKNVHGVTKDTGSLRDAITQARYSALGKGGA